jgi:F-type H+-transporting ATPase subunit gamma
MPSTKEFDRKLNRLKNTKKITYTMKLVAMSKLYRAHEAQKKAKTYAQRLTDLISRLAANVENTAHPLIMARPEVNNALILIMTSDRGLCGSFNNTLIKGANAWLRENQTKYKKIDMSFCGKRGWMAFRKQTNVKKLYEGSTGSPNFETAKKIGSDIMADFLKGEYDEVYLTYNVFNSPLSQAPTFQKILPLEPKEVVREAKGFTADYLFEPEQQELLDFLVPKYLFFRIYFALLENSAGEHGARMTAMDNASKNAADMIDRISLLRNRARQANITKELIEIVSGAEALN